MFLATDINLPGKNNAVALQFEENQITFKTNSFNRVDEGNAHFFYFIYFSFFISNGNLLFMLESAPKFHIRDVFKKKTVKRMTSSKKVEGGQV